MKNIKVYNKLNLLISNNNFCENQKLEEKLKYMNTSDFWGKPERWVRAKELMENGNPEEPEHWMWHSEHYEDSDVLQIEERNITYIVNEINELGHTVEVTKERIENWVLLKADYTIEVIDLDTDYDWLLNECHRKRKEEYPPYEDYLDAVVKNDEVQKQEYIDKCLEVKRKYPKPKKGEI